MNPVQKLLQPLIDMARATKELEWAEVILLRASGTLAALTLADFVTLAAVPAVEWNCEQTDYGCNWTTPHSSWEICEIDPGTQDQRCDAINEDEDTGKSFITIDHAKRYVEICIHLETIKRQLLAELAGGV